MNFVLPNQAPITTQKIKHLPWWTENIETNGTENVATMKGNPSKNSVEYCRIIRYNDQNTLDPEPGHWLTEWIALVNWNLRHKPNNTHISSSLHLYPHILRNWVSTPFLKKKKPSSSLLITSTTTPKPSSRFKPKPPLNVSNPIHTKPLKV